MSLIVDCFCPGFAGKSAFDAAWVDAIADQYKDYSNEIQPALRKIYHGGNKEGTYKHFMCEMTFQPLINWNSELARL